MTVVAGVDDSPVSQAVLSRAAEQARWRGADLHVVHVLYMPMFYTEVPLDLVEVSRTQRNAVWSELEPSLSGIEGMDVRRVDLEGYPPDELVRYASQKEASLLVVGTRGRGELASLILGSTSHRAIHLAHCDVLVVKEPEKRAT